MADVADRMVTGFHHQSGLFEQFAGYFELEDIDLAEYAGRMVPMDVVLGRERTQRSQVLKQADVVALFAMLPDAYDKKVQATNFRYYEPRCGHGSSLSRGLHALVARLGDIDLAERYFHETALSIWPTLQEAQPAVCILLHSAAYGRRLFSASPVCLAARTPSPWAAPARSVGGNGISPALARTARACANRCGGSIVEGDVEQGEPMLPPPGEQSTELKPLQEQQLFGRTRSTTAQLDLGPATKRYRGRRARRLPQFATT